MASRGIDGTYISVYLRGNYMLADFYEAIKRGYKTDAMCSAAQFTVIVILITGWKEVFFLMKPGRPDTGGFRGGGKLQLDNGHCFTASCPGKGGGGGGRNHGGEQSPGGDPPRSAEVGHKQQVTVRLARLSWQRALNWWSCPTELINHGIHHQRSRQPSSPNPGLNKWRLVWYKTYIGLHFACYINNSPA